MSGRSGFRKTTKRASPQAKILKFRPLRDLSRTRADGRPEIRLTFLLPATLAFAVTEGTYGFGVRVRAGGLVEIKSWSRDHVCDLAAEFLQRIGRHHPPVSIAGRMTSSAREGWQDSYEITLIDGHVVIVRAALKPAVYAAPA